MISSSTFKLAVFTAYTTFRHMMIWTCPCSCTNVLISTSAIIRFSLTFMMQCAVFSKGKLTGLSSSQSFHHNATSLQYSSSKNHGRIRYSGNRYLYILTYKIEIGSFLIVIVPYLAQLSPHIPQCLSFILLDSSTDVAHQNLSLRNRAFVPSFVHFSYSV